MGGPRCRCLAGTVVLAPCCMLRHRRLVASWLVVRPDGPPQHAICAASSGGGTLSLTTESSLSRWFVVVTAAY